MSGWLIPLLAGAATGILSGFGVGGGSLLLIYMTSFAGVPQNLAQGINLLSLPLGTQLKLGSEVIVEISQIGKVCHTRCAIYYLAGDCIFPHEGIFGVVLHGGEVHTGDDIQVVKLGDGTCSFTPAEALKEVERARREGTL